MSVNLNTLPVNQFDRICSYLTPTDVLSLRGVCSSTNTIFPETTIAQKVALAASFLKNRLKMQVNSAYACNNRGTELGIDFAAMTISALFSKHAKIIDLCLRTFTQEELKKIDHFFSNSDTIDRICRLNEQKTLAAVHDFKELEVENTPSFQARSHAISSFIEAKKHQHAFFVDGQEIFPMAFWCEKNAMKCIYKTEAEEETLAFVSNIQKYVAGMVFSALPHDDKQLIINTFCQTQEDRQVAEKLSVFNMKFSWTAAKFAMKFFEKHRFPINDSESVFDSIESNLPDSTREKIANNGGWFWKIKDANGHKGYLLGTLHELPVGFQAQKIFNQILPYLDKSKVVSGEIDYNMSYHHTIAIMDMYLKKLEELSPEDRAISAHEARRWLSALGQEWAKELDDEQAVMALITFLNQLVRKEGSIVHGLDYILFNRAKERNIPTCFLEGLERYNGVGEEIMTEDMSILDALKCHQGLPEDELLAEVKEGIKKGIRKKRYDITRQWQEFRKGDLIHLGCDRWQEWLGDRNVVMAKKIAELVNNNDRSFHMIGGGHMTGERDLLSCLHDLGLTVTRKSLI